VQTPMTVVVKYDCKKVLLFSVQESLAVDGLVEDPGKVDTERQAS